MAGEERLLHLPVAPQNLRMMGRDPHRHNHAPQLTPGERVDAASEQSAEESELRWICDLESCHDEHPPGSCRNFSSKGTDWLSKGPRPGTVSSIRRKDWNQQQPISPP